MANYTDEQIAALAEEYNTDEYTVRAALEMQDAEQLMPVRGNLRRQSDMLNYIGDPGSEGGDDEPATAALSGEQVDSGRFIDFAALADGRQPSSGMPSTNGGFIDFAAMVDSFEGPEQAPVKQERSFGDALSDTGKQIGAGINSVLGAPFSLIDPTGEAAKFFNDGTKFWNENQSEAMKSMLAKREQEITESAKNGEWEAFKTSLSTALSEPAIASKIVFETLPSMIPVFGAAKAATLLSEVAKVTPKAAVWLERAAMAGTNSALTAGDARQGAFEDLKNTYIKSGMSEAEATSRALEESKTPAAIGAGFGALGGAFGAEANILGKTVGKTATGRATSAFVSETGTELGEEIAPVVSTNMIASETDDRPWSQNVGRTAADTLIGVGPMATMGAAGAALHKEVTPKDILDPNKSIDEAIATADASLGAAGDDIVQQAINYYDDAAQARDAAATQALAEDLKLQGSQRQVEINATMDQQQRAESVDPLINSQSATPGFEKPSFTTGSGGLDTNVPIIGQEQTQGSANIIVPGREYEVDAYVVAQQKQAAGTALSSYEAALLRNPPVQAGPSIITPDKIEKRSGGQAAIEAEKTRLDAMRKSQPALDAEAAQQELNPAQVTTPGGSATPTPLVNVQPGNKPMTQQTIEAQESNPIGKTPTHVGGQNADLLSNEQLQAIIQDKRTHHNTRRAAQAVLGARFSTNRAGAEESPVFPDVEDNVAATVEQAQPQQGPEVKTTDHPDALDLKASFEKSGIAGEVLLENDNVEAGRTQISKGTNKVLKGLAKLLRKRIVYYSSNKPTPGGAVKQSEKDNRIWINVNDDVTPLAVLGHETLHKLKQQSPKAYATLRGAMAGLLTDDVLAKEWRNYFAADEKRAGMTDEEISKALQNSDTREMIVEEMLGDMAGNRFTEAEFWQQVFDKIEKTEGREKAKGLIAKLKEAVLLAISKIQSMLRGSKFEADQFLDEIEQLDGVRKALSTAYSQYIQDIRDGKVASEESVGAEGAGAKFAARKAAEERKGRTLDEVRGRIAEDHNLTVADNPRLMKDGRPFVEMDTKQEGTGVLFPRKGAAEKLQAMLEKAAAESLLPAAELAKVTVPTVEFLDEAFKLPAEARFWYELSAYGFGGGYFDLTNERTEHLIDIVAATSGGQKPTDNVRVAIAAMAQETQNKPVTVGVRDGASLTQSLSPEALQTHKFGNFSDTMQLLAGLRPGVEPLPTIDLQMAAVFKMPHADIASNPVMYETLSRFLIMVRDEQNKYVGKSKQPYESWQIQALAWVLQRGTSDPDSYDTAMPKIVKQLNDAGIPTPGGKVTEETLRDPRTPDVLAPSAKFAGEAQTATIETRTMLTEVGKASADTFEQLQGIDAPWARKLRDEFVAIQRRTMKALGQRIKLPTRKTRVSSLIGQLMSFAAGKEVYNWGASRVDTDGMGTFEGDLSPNMRVPLLVTSSGGATFEDRNQLLTPTQSRFVLAVLGKALNQAAMASSQFVPTNLGKHQTFSILVRNYGNEAAPSEALAKISRSLGRPINYSQVANGWRIDINVGGFDPVTDEAVVENAVDDAFGKDVDSVKLPMSYDSEYMEAGDYDKAIDGFLKEIEDGLQNSDSGRVGKARGKPRRDLGDFTRIQQAIGEVASEQEQSFAKWNEDARAKLAKRRPDAASSPESGGGAAKFSPVRKQKGAIAAEGVHYSTTERKTLSSSAFGTGLKGAELERVQNAKDPRIKHRIYFYINGGNGINPEAGVGAHAHKANLSNLYDHVADSDDLKLGRDANEFESAVLDAGYDGYADTDRGIAILLGQRTQPVEYVGIGEKPVTEKVKNADKSEYGKAVQSVMDNKSLPGGQMNGAGWKKALPDLDLSHLDDKKDYYKNQIIKRPDALFSLPRQRAVDTNSPEFKRWFKGSKVVDENGEPLRVYRGAEAADKTMGARFFTANPAIANDYSAEAVRGVTIPALLSLTNPVPEKYLRGEFEPESAAYNKDFVEWAKSEGYDGYIFDDLGSASGELGGKNYVVFDDAQIKSAISNTGEFSDTNPDIRYSLPRTPQFDKWFGSSTITDSDGNPAVMYHGTSRDIEVFKPKQADAIFLTFDPEFAEGFADMSQSWLTRNYSDWMTPEQIEKAKTAAIKAIKKDNPPGRWRDENMREVDNGYASNDYLAAEIEKALPSNANIMPLYVRAENPFDFRNPAHTQALEKAIGSKWDGYEYMNGEQYETTFRIGDLERGEWNAIESDAVQQYIRQNHDSFWVRENGTTNLAVLDPNQVKSASGNDGTYSTENNDIRYSLPRQQPWYYSQLEKGISGAKMKTQPANQWALWIKSQQQFKKDEVEWSGVLDYLAMRGKDKITSDELAQWVAENGVKVTETVLGGDSKRRDYGTTMLSDDEWAVVDADSIIESGFESEEEAEAWIDEQSDVSGRTKFSDYTLPGGENYRELLITLPVEVEKQGAGKYIVRSNGEAAFGETEAAALKNANAFRSSHFDQPNILAHIRFNERTDADGRRVLFLEELQSDWGQKGKKEGFDVEATVREEKSPRGNIEYAVYYGNHREVAYASREMAEDFAKAGYHKLRNTPSAPFVTDTKAWTSLALKRAIAYAADNGFDAIAWTTGEQQAERYDLSKQVDSVEYKSNTGDRYFVTARGKSGDIVWRNEDASVGEIEDTIGKELAKKIVDGQGEEIVEDVFGSKFKQKKLSGLDLKVGGEGMRGYYDQIVPQVAKKLGASVGTVRIGTTKIDQRTDRLGFDKSEIQFKREYNGMWSVSKGAEYVAPGEGRYWTGSDWSHSDDDSRLFDTREAAEASLGTLQPGFTLTDKMRGPQALFSTRRWKGTRTRGDFLVPDTPHYLNSDDVDLATYDGLPVRLTVGIDAGKRGMDHLYGNGERDPAMRGAESVDGDTGEGHIREVMRILKYANLEYPDEGEKVKLSSPLSNKAVVLQKRRNGGYWSVVTTLPKAQSNKWGSPRKIDRPRLVDPDASTSSASYYERLPNYKSKTVSSGSLNSEWFDVTAPDGGGQISATTKKRRVPDAEAMRNDGLKASTPRIIGNSGRPYTAEQQSLFKNVGREVDEKTAVEKLKEWLGKRWKQGIFDQFEPFRHINKHAYTLMRLAKGSSGAFEAFMKHGKLSIKDGAFDADTSGGVLKDVFIPLGKETTDFLYWIAGNRAERLAAEGKERLFSKADIAAAKSLATGDLDFDYVLSNGNVTRDRGEAYKDSLKKFNDYSKNVMDMAEQSGLIDGTSRHLWEHEFYVPFYRVMEDEESSIRGMNIKQGIVRQKAFERLKGGEQQLGDLLQNTLMNWAHIIDASSKNRAAKAAIEAAAQDKVAAPARHGEKNTVWFMDGGKKVEYTVSDIGVMDAITALEYAGMNNFAMRVLQAPKHWLTVGVTASPFFKVRNLIRDSLQVVATSDINYNVLGNVAEGWALTDRDRQEYVSALAAGGLIRFGTMLEGNEAERARQLVRKGAKNSHMLDHQGALAKFYDKALEPILEAYNEMGNRGEEINRMALYNQLIKKGVSHAEAAMQARDLMDFSLQGSFKTVRFLAQLVPFFNARMQGMYKLGRATKENRAHMATMIFAASVAGLALMAYAAGDDDRWKKWKKREEWDKANYWYFSIGGMEFRIPRPFELGTVAFMADRTVEAMMDKERDAAKRGALSILAAAQSQLSMDITPQALKPILDIYANKDSFTKRPIETLSMQRLDPAERYTAHTWLPARSLSSAVGGALSPVQIEHLTRGYFGWLGAFSVGTGDLISRSISDEPTKPALDYWKFATDGMIKEDPGSSRYVSLVYEQAKELEQAHATYNRLRKEGKLDEAKEYKEDNEDKLKAYRSVESVKKQLSKISERIRLIERSDKHPAEKRILIRELRARQSEISQKLSQ